MTTEASPWSLVLVLIVTPVLFYWLRERDLRRAEREAAVASPREQGGPALGPARAQGRGRAQAIRRSDVATGRREDDGEARHRTR